VAFGLRNTEQDADRLHRQFGRDVDEEVERCVVRDTAHQGAGPASELRFQTADHARGHAGAHETADARVPGVIHHVEDDTGHVEVLQQRPAPITSSSALRGVRLGIAQDGEGLCIGGDRPEPFAIGRVRCRLVPPHRCLPPVDLEEWVREPDCEVVEIGEIDGGERGHAGRLLHRVPQRVKVEYPFRIAVY
jgi:hypothetical protein